MLKIPFLRCSAATAADAASAACRNDHTPPASPTSGSQPRRTASVCAPPTRERYRARTGRRTATRPHRDSRTPDAPTPPRRQTSGGTPKADPDPTGHSRSSPALPSAPTASRRSSARSTGACGQPVRRTPTPLCRRCGVGSSPRMRHRTGAGCSQSRQRRRQMNDRLRLHRRDQPARRRRV